MAFAAAAIGGVPIDTRALPRTVFLPKAESSSRVPEDAAGMTSERSEDGMEAA